MGDAVESLQNLGQIWLMIVNQGRDAACNTSASPSCSLPFSPPSSSYMHKENSLHCPAATAKALCRPAPVSLSPSLLLHGRFPVELAAALAWVVFSSLSISVPLKKNKDLFLHLLRGRELGTEAMSMPWPGPISPIISRRRPYFTILPSRNITR